MRTKQTRTMKKVNRYRKLYSISCLVFLLGFDMALVLNPPQALALEIGYSGRLQEESGKSIEGPIDFTVKFYNDPSGGDTVGPVLNLSNTELRDGVFQLSLNFDNGQLSSIFGDGSKSAFVEVTAGGKVYPRQRLIAVPLALRVPVDTSTLDYTNDGKLSVENLPISKISGLTEALAAKVESANPSAARTNLGLGSLATASPVTSSMIASNTIVDSNISSSAAIADTKLATISTVGKVSGSAITSGTIGGTTAINSSGAITTSGEITGTGNIVVNGTGAATTELRFNSKNNSNYVGFKAPDPLNATRVWTLPDEDGTSGQVLRTDGSGNLSWLNIPGGGNMIAANNLSELTATAGAARTNLGLGSLATASAVTSALITDGTIVDADINASAAIADTKLATISTAGKVSGSAITSGTISGSTVVATSGQLSSTGNIRVAGTGMTATELRFGDQNDSNYVAFKAPDTVGTNMVWTLPATDGTANQALSTNASGVLQWVSPMLAGNNLSEVSNQTAARSNLGLGTLATTSAVTSALITDGTIVDADINATAAIVDTKLATITTAGKISGSAITSGTIAGSTIFNTTGAVTTSAAITGQGMIVNSTGAAPTELRFNDLDNSNYVGFKSPGVVAANRVWTLPAADGTNGQILKTDGSGALSWVDPGGVGDLLASNNLSELAGTASSARTNLGLGSLATESTVTSALITDGTIVDGDINASAAIADTKLATISTAGKVSGSAITSGTIAGSTIFNTTGAVTTSAAVTGQNVIVNSTGAAPTELRFNDLNNSNYVGFKSPDNVTANRIWTLPAADGTNGQILKTDGSGTLSWISAGGGGDLHASNNLSDLANAGTARTNLGLGTLATNSAVSSALITDYTIVDADINATAAIADTKLATISTAGKVSGSAITSGTIAGSTIFNTTGAVTTTAAITGTGNIIVNGTGAAATELRFNDNDNTNYVGFKSPGVVAANRVWTLPSADGTNGQLLKTDGSGALSWVSAGGGGDLFAANNLSDVANASTARTNLGLGTLATNSAVISALITDGTIVDADINASAAIADTKLATISTAGKVSGSAITSGTIAGSTIFNTTGAVTTSAAVTGQNVIVNSTGAAATELRFNDNDNSNYVGFKSPGIVAANRVWTLPAADGTNGQLLKTDGSGALSWVSAGGGGDLFAANNLSDVANASTARTNLGLGTLATNSAVISALITDGTIVDADINASAAIADTKLATISTAGKVSGSAITSGTIGGSTIVTTTGQVSSSGNIRVAGTGVTATELRFGDNDDSNYVGFKSPATVGTNLIWTLPATDGTANQSLSTNASGVLQWVTPMLGSNNLSELANASTARTNLGLGTLATNSAVTSAFITDNTIVDADINASAAIADTKLATISTAGKVSGSAITSGTIAGSTIFNTTGGVTTSAAITGQNVIVNSTGSAATELRFNDNDNSNYVGFKSPATIGTNLIWTLPATDGTANQSLSTNASGVLQWVTPLLASNNLSDLANASTARTNLGLGTLATNSAVTSALITDGTIVDADINASAAIADTKLATISTAGKVSGSAITSGTIAGTTIFNTSGAVTTSAAITGQNIIVNGTGAATTELRFNDDNNSNYVGFKAPGTVGANRIWTLPAADGTANQALSTNASGVLQWVTPMLGSSNLSELTNTTTARTNLGLGTLATNSAVTSALITDGTIVDADINASAAIADTKLATISTAGKVSGSAITSGTIAGSTIFNTSGAITTSAAITGTGHIIVNGTGSATTELRFNDNDNTNYVGFKAPASVTTNKIWTLPAADGTSGQLLKTDGTGSLSWASGSGSMTGTGGGAAPNPSSGCPTGYILVPGDADFSTTDFCVMKYEAKYDNKGAASFAIGIPARIHDQGQARSACRNLGPGYALINNAEWMTLASNLANVGTNWSSGTVGTGAINRGHSDTAPADALAAVTNDNDPCNGTGQTCSSSTWHNQRRTHVLSNSNVIWDLAGNVGEWVDYYNRDNKPTPATAAWYEITAITGSTVTPKTMLVPTTAVKAWWNNSWNGATNGIGKMYPDAQNAGGGVVRGGVWSNGLESGVFAIDLSNDPTNANTYIGFRCVFRPSSP